MSTLALEKLHKEHHDLKNLLACITCLTDMIAMSLEESTDANLKEALSSDLELMKETGQNLNDKVESLVDSVRSILTP